MSGKVYMDISTDQKAGVVIPQNALCHRPEVGDFVWVTNESTSRVSLRKVTKGDLLPSGKVLITKGLSADETIATSGLRFLSDGMEVEISSKK